MEIAKAKIKNLYVGLDESDNLCASLIFENKNREICFSHTFKFSDPEDVFRLEKLMKYTSTKRIENLEGSTIHIFFDGSLLGYINPMMDKFIALYSERCIEHML